MLDRLDGEVHVEVRPVEVLGALENDVHEFSDRNLPKPRKVPEGEKEFSIIHEKPESVAGYVADLSSRSALPTRVGSHPRALQSAGSPGPGGSD
jgi:hypothetical protein